MAETDKKAPAKMTLEQRVERLERMAGIPTGNAAKRIAAVAEEGRAVVEAREAEAAAKAAEKAATAARAKADAMNEQGGEALAG